MTTEQLALLNRSLDALHEEVAAARAPSAWPFVLFLLSILLPLIGGIWLLFRAEQSVIGQDEQIRWLVRAGMTSTVIHAYLEEAHQPRLPPPYGHTPPPLRRRLMPPRQHHWRRRHRRGRRHRRRRRVP